MPQSDLFPAQARPSRTGPDWAVDARSLGDTTVIEVSGSLSHGLLAMHREVLYTLAEQPGAIVCDISGAAGDIDDHTAQTIDSMSDQARICSASPLGVICSPAQVKQLAAHSSTSRRMPDRHGAIRWISGFSEPPRIVRTRLAPDVRSGKSARDFLAHTWACWGVEGRVHDGKLVVNELVTNAVLHAQTEIQVTLAACDERLRVSVQDGLRTDEGSLRRIGTFPDSPSGRGLLLVERLCHSWGVLPTRDGGKTVWAALDD